MATTKQKQRPGIEYINGNFIRVGEVPLHKPEYISPTPNKRNRLINMYASKVWRLIDTEKIEVELNKFYEQAYGNGIADACKVSNAIDL